MGDMESLGSLATVEDVDDKEYQDECHHRRGADKQHLRHIGSLAGYLGLLLVGVIDGGQLGHRTVLLVSDSLIENREYMLGNGFGRVATSSFGIGTILGYHVKLNVVERRLLAPVSQHAVQMDVVVGSFAITTGRHQIVIGIDASCVRLRVGRLLETPVSLAGLLPLVQSLQGNGAHHFDTALVFIKVVADGIGLLAILVQQHLRAVYPVSRLLIPMGIDISHTGINGTHDGFLQATTGSVRLPAVGIVFTGSEETLVGLLVTAQVQLTASDVIQQNGVVKI